MELVAQHGVVGERLEQGKPEGGIPGDLVDLFTSVLALFGQPFERRDRDGEQLDNDGRGDIRGDRECEDGRAGKCTAREDVEIAEQAARRNHLVERGGVEERHRYGRAKPEQNNNHQGVDNLLLQLRDTPRIPQGCEHLTSPRPSRLLSRFSLWQTKKKLHS